MDYLLSETTIRLVGGLAFLFILYSIWMGSKKTPGLPGGYRNPVLALELVENGKDIDQIVKAEGGEVAKVIRRSTNKDFGFILVYALSLLTLSLLLAKVNAEGYLRLVGCFAAGLAALAAVFDLAENLGMLKALAGEASDQLASNIRHASLAKWASLFMFSLLVGFLLAWRRDLFAIPAAFLLIAALLGFYGVFANFLKPRFYSAFTWSMISLGVGISILAVMLIFWPAKLLVRAAS